MVLGLLAALNFFAVDDNFAKAEPAAAIAGAAIGAAAVGYAVGSVVATVPPGCAYQAVAGSNYYVCNGTWFQPYYGNNGLYYRVVPPL